MSEHEKKTAEVQKRLEDEQKLAIERVSFYLSLGSSRLFVFNNMLHICSLWFHFNSKFIIPFLDQFENQRIARKFTARH